MAILQLHAPSDTVTYYGPLGVPIGEHVVLVTLEPYHAALCRQAAVCRDVLCKPRGEASVLCKLCGQSVSNRCLQYWYLDSYFLTS